MICFVMKRGLYCFFSWFRSICLFRVLRFFDFAFDYRFFSNIMNMFFRYISGLNGFNYKRILMVFILKVEDNFNFRFYLI